MTKANSIREKARELGFELVGLAPANPPPDFEFFRWWLNQGFAGMMSYLKKGEEKRGEPEKILPGVKSLVCCGLNYYTGEKSSHPPFEKGGQGGISNYAWGKDYHKVIGERLRSLEIFIQSFDPKAKTKSYVDTGPILERSYAARAGLGWIGKNTCLINNGVGSFVFLGEILTTLEFDPSEYDRPGTDQCGTCTKCLDTCPTGALPEPYVLDSNKCISYLTIEYRGNFTEEQSKMVGGHVYGCDICQEVCPYNDRIPTTPLKELQPRAKLSPGNLADLKEIGAEEFQYLVHGSAMSRIKPLQWKRNLAAALKNRKWLK